MKAKVQLYTLLCSIFIFTSSIIYSQTCTQCDNISNPQGAYASEIGQNTTASGSYSFAGGINSSAIELASFAFGASALANDVYAVSLGAMTTADNSNSFALGSFCKASGTSSFVLGNGPNSASILTNSIGYSLMVGFNSDKSTLFVSPSGGNGSTGKIGIGDVTDPLAKLHIKADDDEVEPLLFMEPYTFTGGESAKLRLGTMDYGISSGSGKLYFVTGGNYLFNSTNAKVGIGTLTPTEKLEVAGNVKISSGYAITSRVQAIDNKGLSLTNTLGKGIIIANDGKVGIGTISTPTEKLDVNGKVKSTSLQITTGFANGKLLQSDAFGNAVWTNPAWTIGLYNNIYRINGNVGVGNPNPTYKLDVLNDEASDYIASFKSSSPYSKGIYIKAGLGPAYSSVPLLKIEDNSQTEVRFIVTAGGKTGIGTDSPDEKLDINGKLNMRDNIKLNGNWLSGDGGNEGMFVDVNGNVGIGKAVPTAMLDVNGDIKATSMTMNNLTVTTKIEAGEIEVKDLSEWKDCVFEYDYKLLSLKETEEYIKQNKHLPNIPSEKEVMENGINVGEMNALLLQKIEELTLYVIQQNKEIQNLKDKIKD